MTETWGCVAAYNQRGVAGIRTIFEGVNPVGSGVVLRLYRLSVFGNHQTSTGPLMRTTTLSRTTYAAGHAPGQQSPRVARYIPVALTPGINPSGLIEFWYGRNVVTTGIAFRRKEVYISAQTYNGTQNSMQWPCAEVEYANFFDVKTGADVQPLTFRAGEGFGLVTGADHNGAPIDVEAIFTTE